MSGFRKFLMQGDLIVIAVGLVVALAFSSLILSFRDDVITPLISSLVGGSHSQGLGFTVNGQFVNIGAFISSIIYFVIFMVVIYFVLVVPYRSYMAARGTAVFGDPPATKACQFCLSGDLAPAATRCPHCGSDQAAPSASAAT